MENESVSYKIKLLREQQIERIRHSHEPPTPPPPSLDRQQYTERVLEAMRQERDQLRFRLRALDNNIEQAEDYLASITPPEIA